MGRIIFTDFDGTITLIDSCFTMVKAFASSGWEEIDRLWQEKKLSTRECAAKTFQLFEAKPADLEALLETVGIDPYFPEFVRLAEEHGDAVVVLSDGYDFNIQTVFRRYGLDLPFYANRLLYDGSFTIDCVYRNPECGQCGTCKKKLMQTLNTSGGQTVYIGDGYSDFCAAAQADIIFAKKSLLRYCNEKEISATPYRHFGDIIRSLYPERSGML